DSRTHRRAQSVLLANNGRAAEHRPLHPGPRPVGIGPLCDGGLALGPRARPLLSRGTEDGRGRPTRGPGPAARGILGAAVSVRGCLMKALRQPSLSAARRTTEARHFTGTKSVRLAERVEDPLAHRSDVVHAEPRGFDDLARNDLSEGIVATC